MEFFKTISASSGENLSNLLFPPFLFLFNPPFSRHATAISEAKAGVFSVIRSVRFPPALFRVLVIDPMRFGYMRPQKSPLPIFPGRGFHAVYSVFTAVFLGLFRAPGQATAEVGAPVATPEDGEHPGVGHFGGNAAEAVTAEDGRHAVEFHGMNVFQPRKGVRRKGIDGACHRDLLDLAAQFVILSHTK